MLHYNPRHVSSINMPIFRRTNLLSQHLVSSLSVHTVQNARWEQTAEQSALIRHTVLYCTVCTESDDTRSCDNAICPPEDGHVDARNMSKILM